jgi:hypothetical protein
MWATARRRMRRGLLRLTIERAGPRPDHRGLAQAVCRRRPRRADGRWLAGRGLLGVGGIPRPSAHPHGRCAPRGATRTPSRSASAATSRRGTPSRGLVAPYPILDGHVQRPWADDARRRLRTAGGVRLAAARHPAVAGARELLLNLCTTTSEQLEALATVAGSVARRLIISPFRRLSTSSPGFADDMRETTRGAASSRMWFFSRTSISLAERERLPRGIEGSSDGSPQASRRRRILRSENRSRRQEPSVEREVGGEPDRTFARSKLSRRPLTASIAAGLNGKMLRCFRAALNPRRTSGVDERRHPKPRASSASGTSSATISRTPGKCRLLVGRKSVEVLVHRRHRCGLIVQSLGPRVASDA